MKICTKCGQSLPLEEFHRDRQKKSGFRPDCKACNCRRVKAHKDANPEQHQSYMREYYRQNRESVLSYHKDYRRANLERFRQARRKKYWKDPEPARRAALQWAKDNPDKVAVREGRRRARKARNWTDPRPEDVARRKALYEMAAWLREQGDDVVVDHIVPVALGGPETYSNLRILTRSANASKGARPPTDEELEVVSLMVQSCG